MRIFLLAGIYAGAVGMTSYASAADLRYPPPGPGPIPFSWSGCYAGAHAGSSAGHTTWQDPVPNGDIDATMTGQTANTDMSGALYGGQLGCDWQLDASNWVLGLRGAISGSTLTGTNMDQFNNTWALRTQTDWMGSITGRVGWSVDHVLIYGTGGVAWAHNKFEIENTAILDGTPQATRVGWVVGGGVEWAFAPSWSVFAEADYYNFAGKTVNFAGDLVNPTPPFAVKTAQTVESLLFGVNYRFGH